MVLFLHEGLAEIMQSILTPQARFEYALNILLQDEGGYSDDVDDPGGATNLGITQEDLIDYHQKLGLPANVKDLTREDAAKFYKIMWWDRFHYEAINSLDIGTKVFDLAVNIGACEAHKLLQRALVRCGYSTMTIDGILGPKTIAATNECTLHGREDDLMTELCEGAANYYATITEEDPKLYKFLKGWLRRASSRP
jgi:type VI secretion system secreted protein VgrG